MGGGSGWERYQGRRRILFASSRTLVSIAGWTIHTPPLAHEQKRATTADVGEEEKPQGRKAVVVEGVE